MPSTAEGQGKERGPLEHWQMNECKWLLGPGWFSAPVCPRVGGGRTVLAPLPEPSVQLWGQGPGLAIQCK